MKQKAQKFREECPRKLKNLPNSPCPLALLRIEFLQSGIRETGDLPGCSWYVNECTSNYCFFNYINNDLFCYHSTKEISQLLCLTNAQIEKAEKTACEKLGVFEGTEEIELVRETLAELNRAGSDDTIYSIGSFNSDALDEWESTFGLGDLTEGKEPYVEKPANKAKQSTKERSSRKKS